MNETIQKMISCLKSNEAKRLLDLPFALRTYYDKDITGIFSYNDTSDPQNVVEDVEFDFNPEYICYPVLDMKVENGNLVFNCTDPLASYVGSHGYFEQYKPAEFMAGTDVLKMLESSPAFQDVEDIVINVGDKAGKTRYGSAILEMPSLEDAYVDSVNVIKKPEHHKEKLQPQFKMCTIGDFDGYVDGIDFYNMPWSSVMAMDAYFKYQDDLKSTDDRYYDGY